MEDFVAGYRRFRAGTWRNERARFDELSKFGQKPRALVIGCSDSRTDPQMVFNAAPGELFVIRNVANLVPPYRPDDQPHGISAAIAFAVQALKVPQIIVMGHAMCGGIQALLNGAPAEVSDFVGQWVRCSHTSCRRSAGAAMARNRAGSAMRESVRLSLDNLMTFPWIARAISAGTLKLHGCFFDIRSGILERLGADGIFRAIAD